MHITHDLAGGFFHDLIPFEVRKVLAAFYTHPVAAEVTSCLTIDFRDETIIDPAWGSGNSEMIYAISVNSEVARRGGMKRLGIFRHLFKTEFDELREKKDVEGLINLFKKEVGFRHDIVVALVEILKERGDFEGLANLLEIVSKKIFFSTSNFYKAGIVTALVEAGEPAIRPLLKTSKIHADYYEQHSLQALRDVLKKVGEPASEILVKALSDEDVDVRRVAAFILGGQGDIKVVEPLIDSLEDDDEDVRYQSARALERIGEQAVAPLINSLKDESPKVRWMSARSLNNIAFKCGGSVAQEAIAPLKRLYREDTDSDVRFWAIHALEEIAGKEERICLVKEVALTKFALWTSGGNCDVCSEPLRSDAAFQIPVDVFYSSPRYRKWFSFNIWPELRATGVPSGWTVDMALADMRSRDQTSHSAVCYKCVDLFL